jgi:L-xylulokinase
MDKYLLGIDNGGTMTKCAIFDLQGNEIAVASEKTPLIIPHDGYAERDMNDLWAANVRVIREALQKADITSDEIVGIGCTGHGKGLYLWGRDNKPAYNAIASTDSRASSYIAKWKESGVAEKAKKKTLQYPLACQPVALLAWLKEHKSEVYNNIQWVFEAKDFTRFMLTGEAFAEITDYSGTSLMNLITSSFDEELLELFDLKEVYNKMPPLRYSYETCGKVTSKAAKLTGLAEGTPVSGGMFDIDACAIAMDVTDEQQLCVITGTWSINEYISRIPVSKSPTTLNSLFCLPGYYLIEESSATSAGNLDWFVDTFMTEEIALAKQKGKSVYKQVDDIVANLDAESSDIIFLPFLYGTNSPNYNSAIFDGLNNSHDKRHLLRAIFEGVVFSHYDHLQKLLLAREAPKTIRLAGGAANSKVWVQMFADVFNIPIEVVKVKELGTLGCAMSGAVAAGYFADYKDAAAQMVKIENAVYPNEQQHEIYMKKYDKYKRLVNKR